MIVEERIYTLRPGGAARYLQLWREKGRHAQLEILGSPLGIYTCDIGEMNTLTYLWQFASHDERDKRRSQLMRDDRFTQFRSSVRDLVISQRNRLLVPID